MHLEVSLRKNAITFTLYSMLPYAIHCDTHAYIFISIKKKSRYDECKKYTLVCVCNNIASISNYTVSQIVNVS